QLAPPPVGERYFYTGVGVLAVIAAGSFLVPGKSRLAVPLVVCCTVGCLAGFSLKSRPPRDWTAFVSCWKSAAKSCTTVVNPGYRVTVWRNGTISATFDPALVPPDWR